MECRAEKSISEGRQSLAAMWGFSLGSWNRIIVVAMVFLLAEASLVLLPSSSRGSTVATQHDPIVIVGDQEFTAENGVTGGSGTSSNPYIIEGWTIGPNEERTSLAIVNTRVYFTVRDVYIFAAGIGISMNNVTHGRVENSRFLSTTVGVSMFGSDSCKVTTSTFELNEIGVVISYSDATQSKNTFINCTDDVLKLKTDVPIMTTWVGTAVCIAALIPLSLFIGSLLYYRAKSGKLDRDRPPLQ
jgi:hypothetical protein